MLLDIRDLSGDGGAWSNAPDLRRSIVRCPLSNLALQKGHLLKEAVVESSVSRA